MQLQIRHLCKVPAAKQIAADFISISRRASLVPRASLAESTLTLLSVCLSQQDIGMLTEAPRV